MKPVMSNKIKRVERVRDGVEVEFDLLDKTIPCVFLLEGVRNTNPYTHLAPYELAVKISRLNPDIKVVINYLEKTRIRDTTDWYLQRNGGSLT